MGLLILLQLDIGGLGRSIGTSASGSSALLMLLGFFAITFGMLGIAWRVMILLPGEE